MRAVAQAHVHLLNGGRASLATTVETWIGTLDSPRTRTTYKRAVVLAFKIMDRDNPRAVTVGDLAAFKRSQEGRAPSTVALRLSALRSFFKYLAATGLVRTDPTAAITIPKVHSATPRALSLEQAKRIASQINMDKFNGQRDAAAIALLFSGLRVSEVAGLNIGDVALMDQDGHTFTRVKVLGKGAKPREVDLPRRIHELVGQYLDARGGPCDPTMPLFLATVSGYRDQPGRMSADRIYRQFRRYARRAKVRVTGSHTGRHTWASLAEANGAKLMDIMAHLGHANLNVTACYLRRLSGKRNPAYTHVPEIV